MNDPDTGQGWKTYETLIVATHLYNDRQTLAYWRWMARQALKDARPEKPFSHEERAALDLREILKNQIEDIVVDEDDVTPMRGGLLNAALAEVHWLEIAEHLIEEVTE